jgi:LAS superfamily LD-carboxypeptidase LdcB
MDGTASAQVITHYLKLGSSRELLEQERLRHENELTAAKIEAMQTMQQTEQRYAEALAAMSAYSGRDVQARPDD